MLKNNKQIVVINFTLHENIGRINLSFGSQTHTNIHGVRVSFSFPAVML